jgi:hypothetical protein
MYAHTTKRKIIQLLSVMEMVEFDIVLYYNYKNNRGTLHT